MATIENNFRCPFIKAEIARSQQRPGSIQVNFILDCKVDVCPIKGRPATVEGLTMLQAVEKSGKIISGVEREDCPILNNRYQPLTPKDF